MINIKINGKNPKFNNMFIERVMINKSSNMFSMG